MTRTFTEAAEQWTSLAAQLLSWRPEDFWQATPAELATALRDPQTFSAANGPSREHIAQMMERDNHG